MDNKKQVKKQPKDKQKKHFVYNLIEKSKTLNKTTKTIILVLFIIVILCFVFGILNNKAGKLRFSAQSSLEKIVEKNDLETVNYTYNAIAKQPKKEDIPENSTNNDDYKYFVSYEGTVSAGIDFKQVKIDVVKEEKKLVITVLFYVYLVLFSLYKVA